MPNKERYEVTGDVVQSVGVVVNKQSNKKVESEENPNISVTENNKAKNHGDNDEK